jgi:hypothetical protein
VTEVTQRYVRVAVSVITGVVNHICALRYSEKVI